MANLQDNSHVDVFIICLVVYLIISCGFLGLFWHRRELDFIKRRNVPLTIILGVTLVISCIGSMIYWTPWREEINFWRHCLAKIVFDAYFFVLVLTANIVRVLDLFDEYLTNQVEIAISDPSNHQTVDPQTPLLKQAAKMLDIGLAERCLLRLIAVFQYLRIPITKRRANGRTSPQNRTQRAYMNVRGRQNSPLTRYATFFGLSIGYSTLGILLTMATSPTNYFSNPGATYCPLLDNSFVYLTVFSYCLVVPLILLAIRKVEDSFYIRLEHSCMLATAYPLIAAQIAVAVIEDDETGFARWLLSATSWISIIMTVMFLIVIIIPTIYSFRYKRKLNSKTPTYSMDSFEQLLKDEDMFRSFQRTLANDMAVENGLFFKDVDYLRSLFGSGQMKGIFRPMDADFAVDFMIERYFTSGSPCELNVTWPVRKRLLREYDEGERSASMFDAARAEIISLMYWNSYPKWRTSKGSSRAWGRREMFSKGSLTRN